MNTPAFAGLRLPEKSNSLAISLMVCAYLYDGTNAIKDGATEMDVMSK